jgi:hypothetical protein
MTSSEEETSFVERTVGCLVRLLWAQRQPTGPTLSTPPTVYATHTYIGFASPKNAVEA